MRSGTLANFIWMAIWAVMGIVSLIGAIFWNAYWHYVTAVLCFVFAYVMWNDDEYGVESVKQYFVRIRKSKEN